MSLRPARDPGRPPGLEPFGFRLIMLLFGYMAYVVVLCWLFRLEYLDTDLSALTAMPGKRNREKERGPGLGHLEGPQTVSGSAQPYQSVNQERAYSGEGKPGWQKPCWQIYAHGLHGYVGAGARVAPLGTHHEEQ